MSDEKLGRVARVDALHRLIVEGQKHSSGDLTVGEAQKAKAWRESALKVVETVAPNAGWLEAIGACDNRPSVLATLESLRALMSRIANKRGVEIDAALRARIATRSSLTIWGDHVIDLGTGRSSNTFFIDDYNRFAGGEMESLLTKAKDISVAPSAPMLATTIEIASMLEADSFGRSEDAEVWHAGWALLTLGWWIADDIEHPIWIGYYEMVDFDECRATAKQYAQEGHIDCPRCQCDVDVQEDERSRLVSIQWQCRSCKVGGYFPKTPHPRSAWARAEKQRARDDIETMEWLRDESAKNGLEAANTSPAEVAMTAAQDSVQIFVSHSSADARIAKGLIDLIQAFASIPDSGIRCTSVDGYKLQGGDDAPEVLRTNLAGCSVVLGILTASSISSPYVLLELGAAWGFRKRAIPLLAPGVTFADLPGPFRDIHALKLDTPTDMASMLSTIAAATRAERTNNDPKVQAALRALTELVEGAGTRRPFPK